MGTGRKEHLVALVCIVSIVHILLSTSLARKHELFFGGLKFSNFLLFFVLGAANKEL